MSFFFCWFWNPVMSILYKNARNVRFVLFRKNSVRNTDGINNLLKDNRVYYITKTSNIESLNNIWCHNVLANFLSRKNASEESTLAWNPGQMKRTHVLQKFFLKNVIVDSGILKILNLFEYCLWQNKPLFFFYTAAISSMTQYCFE